MSTQDSRPATAAAFTRLSLKPIARSVQLALLAGVAAPALAAPTGGQVRAGSADISTPARGTTVINQRSQRAAIDWRSFDVARNETVRFNQPNAKASALNRIFDQKPSEIFGQIKSNGEVILLNPNGVFFKPGSEVHVGSLIAAAMNVGIDDFMRGRYQLQAQPGSDGRVVNQGRIEAAPGGDVALLGRSVANEGVIVATAGRVSLLAGEKTTVDFDGDGLLRFSVDEAVVENARKLDDQVTNTGEIRADGGQILITARAAEGVFKHAINNGGLIQAGRIDKQGGKVRLTGLGPGASVLNTGTVDASAADIDSRGGRVVVAADTIEQRGTLRAEASGDRGGSVKLVGKSRVALDAGSEISVTSAAAKGGTVKATGEQLELNFDAEVDASGARGGGQVLLGGGARGEDSSLPNASTTFVSGAARIAADATVNGDGGEVVVWADGSTWFYGNISAKGGPAGGNGGFVEVSGKQDLVYRGAVDATAPKGAKGTLLLDPTTLTIIDAATGGEEDAELPDVLVADDAPGGANTVSWGEIVAQGAAADIILEASGDVTVADVTGAAGGAITANDLVTLALDNGSLTLRSVSGNVVFNDVNDVIRTEGGAISIQAGGSVTLGGFDTTGAAGTESGDLSISSGAGGSLGGVIDLGSGTLAIAVTAGTLTQGATANIIGDADVIKSGSGVLVLAAAGNSYTGDTDITGGTLRLGAAGVLPDTTRVTIDTLATFDLNDFNETVASVSSNASTTLDLGTASLVASGNIDLRGTNIVIAGAAGDTALTAGGTLQLDNITKTNTGDLTLTATGGIDLGDDVIVQAGALVLASNFTASADLTASTSITFQGNGTFDGATQTLTATAGNITDAAGQVQTKTSAGNLVLNAGGNIGVNAGNRLGVAVTGGGVLRVNAANVFAESASTLTVDALTTSGAGANTVNIATTGTAALSLTGANSANLANDSITLSSAGNLTISTSNTLAGATVALTAGTGVASATIDLNAVVSGSTSVTLTGAAATSTLDAAGLSGALTFTASGDGTGTVSGGLAASYSGIDALVGGTGADTLVGFTNYSITGANSGTATTPGTMAWSGIENLTGTAGNNTFTLSGGSLSGTIDGLGQTTADKVEGYTTYVVNAASGGTATASGVTTTWQNIETLDGTAGTDSFTLSGGSIGRIDALAGDDTVTLTADTTVTTLLLGAGADTLDLATRTLTGGVDGGSESDTLVGATSYTVTGSGSGTSGNISGSAPTWSAFENLTGTAGDDTFTFNTGAVLTGTVSGLGGNDTFTLNASVSVATLSGGDNNDTFNLGDGTTARVLTGSIDGGNGTDTVVSATTYTLTGAGSGTSSGLGGGGTFSAVENLTGTAGTDTFTVNGGSLSGTVNGAGGTDTLTGDSSYTVTAAGTGTSTAVNAWQGIENLTGTTGVDTFNFNAGGSITGTASGLAGNDIFNLAGAGGGTLSGGDGADTLTLSADSTATLNGGNDNDTFNLAGFTLTGAINGNTGVTTGSESDTIAGASNFVGTGAGSGTSTRISGGWSNIENLTGTSGADTFTFNAGSSLSGTASGLGGNDAYSLAGNVGATLSGGDGADTFTLTANATATLAGGNDNDTFALAGFTLTGSVDGGTGVTTGTESDTIAGVADYTISGANSGTSSKISGGWSNAENLTGTSGADTFTVSGGTLSGTLDGSTNSGDLLQGDTSYTISGANSGTSGAIAQWQNIEELDGSAGADTFTFTTGGQLTGTASGLGGADTFNINGDSSAAGIEGNGGDDTFTFQNGSTEFTGTVDGDTIANNTNTGDLNRFFFLNRAHVVGALDGGREGGAENDVVDFSGSTILNTVDDTPCCTLVTVGGETLQIISGGFVDADFVNPGGIFSSGFTNAFWYISGLDSGFVANSLAELELIVAGGGTTADRKSFSGVVAIGGGSGNDVFIFDATGQMTSAVSGGGGTDSLVGSIGIDSFTVTGSSSVTVNIDVGGGNLATSFTGIENIDGSAGLGGGGAADARFGDVGADTITVTGQTWGGLVNGGGGSDTLVGAAQYSVTGANAGTSTAITGGWSAVENLTGTSGADSFTLAGGGALTGSISGLAGADSFTLTGAASATTLSGGDDADTFDLGGFVLTGAINGGSGGTDNDTVSNGADFTVTGADSGSSTQVTGNFSDIENLTGTTGADSFTFNAGSSLTGAASGGAGADTFTLAGNASAQSLAGDAQADSFDLGGFTLTGAIAGGSETDTLIGSTTYVVTGSNAGTSPNVSLGWSAVENLTGTAGADSFTFNAASQLSGTADGLGGSDTFTLAGNASVATVQGGDDGDTIDLGGFTLTGAVNGGNGGTDDDLLTGVGSLTLTGADSGTSSRVSSGFSEIENLTGTSGNDSFTFNAGSSLTGDARGAGGTDTFTLAGNASAARLIGGTGSDTFNLAGFTLTGEVDGTAGDSDVLAGANNYVVTGADVGTSTQVSAGFSNIENLSGTSGADSFSFDAGAVLTGTADGLGGVDSFVLGGNASAGLLQGGAGDDSFDLGGFTLTGAIDGGGNSDTLTGADNYTLTGANAGTSSRVSGGFSNVENLTGTTGDDTFDLGTGSITGTLDGLGGDDLLTGSTSYTVTGADTGSATGVTLWQNIENLTGTSGNDSFTFNAGSSLTGDARGAGGTDTFTLAGNASAARLIGGTGSDTFNLAGFTLTGEVDGTAGDSDVLAGANNYVVTGADVGTSTQVSAGFSNIENLSGTSGADSFSFDAGAVLTGTADGLGGVDSFVLGGNASAGLLQGGAGDDSFDLGGFTLTGAIDGGGNSDTLTGADNYTLTGANAGTSSRVSGGFSNVENLTGTTGDDTFDLGTGSITGTLDGLGGDDLLTGSTSYTVTGADTGSATGVTLWQNIENLTGTSGNDSFTFNAGSSLTGDARGASGTDTFTLVGNASAARLIGGTGSDTFDLAGFTLTGAIDGTAADSDTLTGANNYVVTGTNSGTSTQVSGGFDNIENLTGTAGVDSFTFTAGGQLTGTADGLASADSFVLGGNASVGLLQGGAGDDSFDLGGFTLTGAVDGGANNDTLVGADNYTVTGADAGTSSRASGGFSNVENLTGTGGADTFTFQAGSSLTGTAAGAGGADSFVLIGNASAGSLAGNGGDDTFNLGGFTLTGAIDGGNGGSDLLRGSDNYVLTGVNSGTSTDVSGGFTEIENLTGTAGNDTFTVNGGTLSGTVNGLAGGAGDRILGDTSYVISGANSGLSGALTAFVNIKNLSGTNGADTFNFQGGSLAGAADGLGGADTFNITASGGAATMQLNGGDNDDVFNFSNDAMLTADINGGNGNDIVNFGTPNANPPAGNTDVSRLIGQIDLGAGAGDRLDISGSDLFTAVAVDAVVSANGRSGTITGINGDPNLLSDGFAGVDDLRGNGKGAIVGANAATFWRVTGTNRGEFSTNSGDIGAPGAAAGANGASTFINFAIRGGTAADTYIFDSAGFIQIGITDTGGANVLVGSAGADTFTLTGARTVDFSVNGSGTTTTVEALAGSLDIDGSVTTLRFPGDTGNDSFVFSGNTNWRGAINGGGGVDTLDLTARTQAATATVSGISAQGLVSTNADFAGEFRNIEVLNTGAGDDVITLSVDPTGNTTSIDTGAGIDEIRSTVDATWVVTGDGAGVIRAGSGPSSANQVQFSGLENLTSTGDANLTLPSSAGAAASLAGAFTADRVTLTSGAVFTGDLGLRIEAPVTSNGSLTLNMGNGNLEMRDSLTVNGNFRMVGPFGDFQAVTTTGSQTYQGEAQLNGNLNAGGDLSFSTFLTIVGNVALNSATNVFDFNGEVQGNTDAVLSIVPTANTDMFIDLEDGPGHIAADRFDTFRGTLVIGGLFEATPDRDLLAGTLRSAPADYITVSSSLVTGGDLMLVGSTVDFSQGVGLEIGSTATTGGDVAILALGDAIQVGNNGLTGGVALGNITGTPGSTTMRFLGNRVMLAARGEIQNSTNMIMALGGGEVLVAQSSQAVQQQVNFNVQSNATPSTENVTDTALVVSLGQIPGAQITSPTGLFQNARVFFPNPAAIITILQAVAFVDSSLFEEDLSLFGVIGDGIAKSLDQCEDAEGCAPSVTAEQLAELIAGIDARIATLEKELAAGDIDRAKGETLLARYRAERKNYTDYQAQLEAYLARQAEEQSGGDEFEDVFEAEETPDAAPAATPEGGEAPAAEDTPSLEENSEDLFAPLEDSPAPEAAPAAPAATPDVDEGFEMLEDEAPAAAPSAPAAPASPAPAAPAGGDDGAGDDFEELEELPDATLLNDTLTPGTVNQLAGMLRLDARGAVTWEGDVLLPTLHRRY